MLGGRVGRQQAVPQGRWAGTWFFAARTAFRGVRLGRRSDSGKGRKVTTGGKAPSRAGKCGGFWPGKEWLPLRIEGDLGFAEIGDEDAVADAERTRRVGA